MAKWRLPEADAAHEDDVGLLFDEAEAEEVFDLQFVDLLGPVPAELIEGLEDGEAGGADAPLHGALLAGAAFALEQALQIVRVRPALRGRGGGERSPA